jgi:hypothetical protein
MMPPRGWAEATEATGWPGLICELSDKQKQKMLCNKLHEVFACCRAYPYIKRKVI